MVMRLMHSDITVQCARKKNFSSVLSRTADGKIFCGDKLSFSGQFGSGAEVSISFFGDKRSLSFGIQDEW